MPQELSTSGRRVESHIHVPSSNVKVTRGAHIRILAKHYRTLTVTAICTSKTHLLTSNGISRLGVLKLTNVYMKTYLIMVIFRDELRFF